MYSFDYVRQQGYLVYFDSDRALTWDGKGEFEVWRTEDHSWWNKDNGDCFEVFGDHLSGAEAEEYAEQWAKDDNRIQELRATRAY